jgi:hypothetical protein
MHFRGFTPLKWESYVGFAPLKGRLCVDPSRSSFLFTLKNRTTLPPTKFPMRTGATLLS